MKNRVWLHVGDLVLCSVWEFEDDKGDIIHKYFPEEIKELKKHGEIPESLEIADPEGQEDNGGIVFEDDGQGPPPQDPKRGKLDFSSSDDEDDEEEEKKEELDIDNI